MSDRRTLIVFDGFQCLYLSERSSNYVFHISNMGNCIAVCLSGRLDPCLPVLQSMVFFDWKCFDLIDAQAAPASQASTVSFEMHLLSGRPSQLG